MSKDMDQLLQIMRTLRDPQKGCPWDAQQDFASIAPYTIEEAYEVADAIQRGDLDELKDELGDLLLQVVFHAQMAAEQQAFSFEDVVQAICDKMIRRHPHVFASPVSGQQAGNPAELKQQWESMKAAERSEKGEDGLLDGIPRGMAELQRATKLTRRAATGGFDWESAQQVMLKVKEETRELEDALQQQHPEQVEEELGDLLFTVVNVARKSGVDAAKALRGANAKFEQRFRQLESIAGGKQNMLSMELQELEAIWQQVKTLQQQAAQAKVGEI